ncbi:MAG: ATPase, T2SS/T4P/T4SS family, partial [Patescibacteria group bacterium]
IVDREIRKPHGMILNTGPTGSGKTSTLYAFLKAKASSEIKIITVEDPIEYHLSSIEQTQVDEEAGYTFANGLRSIMRQDPDAILVGEVRDRDTAEIAVQAALTGHLVFSTVHANEAAGAIPRLLDLGVKPGSISPALNLVIGQRLVRRLCVACKVSRDVDADTAHALKEFLDQLPERVARENSVEIKLWSPKGCSVCGETGYKGRIAVFELLLTKETSGVLSGNGGTLEEIVVGGGSVAAILAFARKGGMVTMQEDGVLKALAGVTTLEEVAEATGPIEYIGKRQRH